MPLPQEKYYTAEEFYAIYFAIKSYIKEKGEKCRVFAAPFNVQLKENEDIVLEPDLSVICDTGKLTKHGCTGAPDRVIEIVLPSNPSYDYITKRCTIAPNTL